MKLLMLVEGDEREGSVRPGIQALTAYLTRIETLDVTVTTVAEIRSALDNVDVACVDLSRRALEAEQEESLWAFVLAGGGLVTFGGSWPGSSCQEGWLAMCEESRGWAPTSEIIARIRDTNHPITRRLDTSFVVTDTFALCAPPPDAEVLIDTSWHYDRLALAASWRAGEGRVFATTVGRADTTLAHPVFQQLLYRAVWYAGGYTEGRPVGVALIGYGAIGFEHGTAIEAVAGLDYVAVCDRSPERREAARRAFPGVRTYADLSDVADDPDIDLVIVSTPPNTHASVAMQMLRADKHVISEKPFCLTVAEADAIMEIAAARRLTLSVYQNRRWDRDFLAIKRVLAAGTIGEVFYIETFIGGFAHPCEYWHSHEPVSGGMVYDWGSHYIDWILELIPDRAHSVVSSAHKRVWHNVTNADQMRVLIRFADGKEAEFLQSDVAAALKPKWYLLGTSGAIVADWRYETIKSRRWSGDLIEEHLAPAEAPANVTVYIRDTSGDIHEQRLSLPAAPIYPFHRNIADHLLLGEPLAVTPESSRRNIVVMEAAQRSIANGSMPVLVDC